MQIHLALFLERLNDLDLELVPNGLGNKYFLWQVGFLGNRDF
jgi:hypothetical protein